MMKPDLLLRATLAALAVSTSAVAQDAPQLKRSQVKQALGVPASIRIECDNLPKAAIRELEPDLKPFFQLACTRYGQMLAANEDWWGKWQGIPRPFFIAAQGNENPAFKDVGNRAYFESVRLDKGSGAEWTVSLKRSDGRSETLTVSSMSEGRTLSDIAAAPQAKDMLEVKSPGMPMPAWFGRLESYPE
jgi:hypothetical protein